MELNKKTLRIAIRRRDQEEIRELCRNEGIPHLARVLTETPPAEARFALLALPVTTAGKALAEMAEAPLRRIVTMRALPDLLPLLEQMESDDLTDVARQVDGPVRAALMEKLPQEKSELVASLITYKEGTVGSIMRTEFFHVPGGATLKKALAILRDRGISPANFHNVYLVDQRMRLKGLVPISQAIMMEPSEVLLPQAIREPVTISPDAPVEEAVRLYRDHDLVVLPVVRSDGAMVGIVTGDDIMDVDEEETTVDFHRMAPVMLKGQSLRDARRGEMILARAPWLVVLVFMNIFSGAGIAHFEETIEAMVALVFFLPLLIDSGGNAGSQAATLMVRALATGDVKMRDWARLFAKEISVSLSLGLLMAVAVASVAAFRAPEILVPVAMTMVCTVLFGSLVGMSLPFLLTRLRLDPATASAPLITSIADIGGVLIYFTIATWYLGPTIAQMAAAG